MDKNENVATLGPIIHNAQLILNLKEKGVKIIETLEQIQLNCTLVIRTHGIPREIFNIIRHKNIRYLDATCPFVSRIHKIVTNIPQNNVILIGGDKNHPEIEGIIGHCNAPSFVFKDQLELQALLNSLYIHPNSEVFVVSQTTFSLSEWHKCLKTLGATFKLIYVSPNAHLPLESQNVQISENSCKSANIFHTICNATVQRQIEAEHIAKESDIMFVVGDPHSSNTAKIKDICCKYCKTYLIETSEDIPKSIIKRKINIGVTAGASTPNNIIKEVLNTMSENLDPKDDLMLDQEEQNFEQMLEESLKNLSKDKKVHGVVVSIAPNEVYVDVGRKQAGFIPLSELSAKPISRPEEVVKIGDEFDLLIMKTNDQEGTIMLSKKRLDAIKGWDILQEASQTGEILKGTVTEVIKGGLLAIYNGVRVFIPASQAAVNRSDSLEHLINKEVAFRIIEVNRMKRRAIGSIRSVLNDEQKLASDEFWKTVEIGTKYTGQVKSLTDYGAFVNIQDKGIDGMIHISELSWKRIRHPSEVVNVGDTVEVYIKDLDHEKRKISLGYKKTADDPWEKFKAAYKVGDIIEVKIVSFTEYGAFAEIISGLDGLIHISQISESKIEKPQNVLKIGQTCKVLITEVDPERKRVSLSVKALETETEIDKN